MIDKILNEFLSKLIDWKEFEQFVAELYRDGQVKVDHNVTETGKSGAKRQIDVRVMQTTAFHTIKIIIECKRWKEKVTRQVIDVLAASVRDLNANKGVIFTTKGYEEGAIQYAKSENIDIIVVRDLTDDEWGKPGRHIMLYMQMFSSIVKNISFTHGQFLSKNGLPPKNAKVSINATLEPNQLYNDSFNIYSIVDNKFGKNILRMIIDAKQDILKEFSNNFSGLFTPAEKRHEKYYRAKVNISFTNTKYRYLKDENGFIEFKTISFENIISVSQSKLEIDRGASAHFVLMVEDYITKQKHYVSKLKDDNLIIKQKAEPTEKKSHDEPLVNGSIMKITTEYYIHFTLPTDAVVEEMPEINVTVIEN